MKISNALKGRKEIPHPARNKEILEKLYIEQGLSANDIAEKLNVGRTTVYRWMEEFSIERRDNSESKLTSHHQLQYFGENHYNYKTGEFSKKNGNYIYINRAGKPTVQHRIIFEEALGRPLKTEERVHHENKDRQDNRIENLMLFENDVAHMNYHEYLELVGMYALGIISEKPKEPTGFIHGKNITT